MLVSVCGCIGDKKDDDVRGEIISGDNKTENDADKDSDTNTETDTEISNEPEFSIGVVTSNTYSNKFLGLSCTLPSKWVFYTDEQMLQLNNIASEFLDDEAKKQLENATIIYDMYAIVEADGSTINVNLEKLNAVQALSLNIKASLEAQIDTIKTAYENMGYTDIDIFYEKVTVDGKELDGLKINAKIQGIDFYGVCFAFKKSNYFANTMICTLLTDETESILNCFKLK